MKLNHTFLISTLITLSLLAGNSFLTAQQFFPKHGFDNKAMVSKPFQQNSQRIPGKEVLGFDNHKKSQSAYETYRMDTTVLFTLGEGNMKFINSYDNSGRILTGIWQKFSTKWDNFTKQVYTYDVNGNVLTYLYQSWVSNNWSNIDLQTFTYDNVGNKLTDLNQHWESDSWQNVTLSTNSYDGSGRIITSLAQQWDNGAWLNNTLISTTYEANTFTELQKSWVTGTWVNSYLSVNETDPAGLWSTYTSQIWDGLGWVNDFRSSYTYDVNGNTLSQTNEFGSEGVWINISKTIYTYNLDNLPLTIIDQTGVGTDWANSRSETRVYNSNGFLLSSLIQDWQDAWVNNSFSEYTFNQEGEWSAFVTQLWNGTSWGNFQKVIYDYSSWQINMEAFEWIEDVWQPTDNYLNASMHYNDLEYNLFFGYGYHAEVHYSIRNAGIGDIHSSNCALMAYPNPVDGILRIKTKIDIPAWGIITVTDLGGQQIRKVFEGVIDSSPIVYDTRMISPGTYLLNLRTADKSENIKISIIR